MKKISSNIKIVLEILNDEIQGRTYAALKKLSKNYTMTWMYRTKNGKLFPRSGKNVKQELKDVYSMKGREYNIKHIAEGDDTVMVEMVENYPDPKTKKVYRTPLVIVLEMSDGKIQRGRHYCDPRLSYEALSKKDIEKAYK